jgi:FtsP/CotA-like multicopper oxidase with cupredoxin domain
LIFGQAPVHSASSARAEGTIFTINGMTGSSIKPMELRKGERIRLRLINASNQVIPISLTGHKLEIVAVNGSDSLEPHIFRDTITLNPSDRVDADFTADNPGVWSLASEIPEQASDLGAFPGGIACVVRYLEYDSDHQ